MISEYSVVPGKPNSDIRDAREEQIANDPDKHEIGKQHEGPTHVGTLFTLFVVPAVYLLIATDHSRAAAPEARQTLPSGAVRSP